MSKVYVINDMNHSYSKAERFGEVVPVTEGKMPIFKTDTMLTILKESLKNYKSDDYLLISGPAIMCIMATSIVFKRFENIKLLVFDAKEQDYVVRHLCQDNM